MKLLTGYISSFALGLGQGLADTCPGNNQARFLWTIPGCSINAPSLLCLCFLLPDRLCGSYEDLQRGQVSDALLDFTGGVTVTIKLAEAPGNLWDILTHATYGRTLIGCQTHSGVRLGCEPAGCLPSLLPPSSATRCCSHLGGSPKTSANPCTYRPDVQLEHLRAGKATIEHR